MKKGFTLIELLVVIAVIGLLASIILVNMKGTTYKAKVAKALQFSQSVHHALGADAVGVWDFDEGSGTTARDGSGYGNNGTIHGAVYDCEDTPYHVVGSGSGKCALRFDGVGDYVNRTVMTGLSPSALTFMFWSKQLGTRSFYMHPIGIFGGHRATVYVVPNSFRYYYKFQSINGVKYEGFVDTLDDRWHFIAVTFDGSYIKFYVDGVLKLTQPASGEITGGDESLFIATTGTGSTPGNNWFSGIIDEVRIYNRAFSIGEIQKMYAEGLGRYQIAEK